MNFQNSSDSALALSYNPYRVLNTFADSKCMGSSVRFDGFEELLWVGSREGRLSSYYGSSLSSYSNFTPLCGGQLRDFCLVDPGVLALSTNGLTLHKRGGYPLYSYPIFNPRMFYCCLSAPSDSLCLPSGSVIIAGNRGVAKKLNVERPDYGEDLHIGDVDTAMLRSSEGFLCFGSASGNVGILDLRSNKLKQHQVTQDGAILCDFDVCDYSLFTCGQAVDHSGNFIPNYSISVYDMRVCKRTSPILTYLAPSLIRFLPKSYGQYCAVADGDGQFQVVSSVATAKFCEQVYQIAPTPVVPVSMDIATSGHGLAVVDELGSVHLLTSEPSSSMHWNLYSRPTTFSEISYQATAGYESPTHQEPYFMTANGHSPPIRKTVPSWPGHSVSQNKLLNCSRSATSEDDLFINSLNENLRIIRKKIVHPCFMISYFRNPQHASEHAGWLTRFPERPYLVQSRSGVDLSLNAKTAVVLRGTASTAELSKGINFRIVNLFNQKYRLIAGLENISLPVLDPLPNCACNAMLQALYHVAPLSTYFRNHICFDEFCLTCEFGFLFHMMAVSENDDPCQASNLLRVMRAIPEAVERGLISKDTTKLTAQDHVQNWIEFVLEYMHNEYLHHSQTELDESPVSQLIAWKALDTIKCESGHFSEAEKNIFTMPLRYCVPQNHFGEDLHKVLEATVNEQTDWFMMCDYCNYENHMNFTRKITSLPESFVLNFRLDDENNFLTMKHLLAEWTTRQKGRRKSELFSPGLSDVKICRYGASCTRPNCIFTHPCDVEGSSFAKKSSTFIPPRIWMRMEEDGTTKVSGVAPFLNHQNWIEYETLAVVHLVHHEEKCVHTLSTAVKVTISRSSSWHIFNDLETTSITEHDALQFDLIRRVPCTVFYQRVDLNERWSTTVINPITRDIFTKFCDMSASLRAHEKNDILPLQQEDTFGSHSLVALDAEFVTLSEKEVDFHLDGTVSDVRPTLMSVGRVTVIRGNGDFVDRIFMDEYIVARDKVVNHLTEFSGIKPGDLSAEVSSKCLSTLKSVYVRLRYLVDVGVQFIGHGLNNDFRVINMKVPQHQLIDTVLIYRLPDQRFISLKFLAWYFLGIHIQIHSHDSTEDARSALRLYEKHVLYTTKDTSCTRSCTFVDLLKQMYDLGRSSQWKVPPSQP